MIILSKIDIDVQCEIAVWWRSAIGFSACLDHRSPA